MTYEEAQKLMQFILEQQAKYEARQAEYQAQYEARQAEYQAQYEARQAEYQAERQEADKQFNSKLAALTERDAEHEALMKTFEIRFKNHVDFALEQHAQTEEIIRDLATETKERLKILTDNIESLAAAIAHLSIQTEVDHQELKNDNRRLELRVDRDLTEIKAVMGKHDATLSELVDALKKVSARVTKLEEK